MQLHLPSQFVCVLLLPCAYCYSSNFVAFIKNLTFGKHFFYDLIKHKKKIGKVFSSHSNLLSVPSAFLYRTALFLYYNGGGGQAIIKLFDHLQKRGVIQTCSLAATQLQRLFVDEDNKNNRILIIWDGIFRHNNYPLHFFYLLSLASFQLELFIGNATIPYCTVSLLRKHGVRLVRSINKNPSATEYLYEFGHTYHNFFIFSDVISHKLVDCMLYVSHGARIICYSSDSKSYNKIHEDISAKLYCIVSKHPEVHLHQGVRFALLPDIQPYMPLSQQFQMMLPLCRKCGLLPVKLFTKFFSERPFPRIFPTRPIITFVVRASIKHDHTKAVFVSLSEAAEHAGLPWEIVTTSDEAAKKTIYPEYIRVLPDKFSSLKEHIIHAVDVARGELIFFVDSNMFLYEGLPEIFEHFQHTPDARICGCNITDSNDMLLHAGALLERDGSVVVAGEGRQLHDMFFSISRSVPMVSSSAFALRKSDFAKSDDPGKLLYITHDEKHIGLQSQVDGYCLLVAQAVAFSAKDMVDPTSDEANADSKIRGLDTSDQLLRRLAEQDTYMPVALATQGSSRAVNVLYFSPYQSHPASHGNRSTIQHFGKIFQEKGCTVHFALLGLDSYAPEDTEAMRDAWDSFTILPYPFQDNSYRGEDIPFDGWYESGLGEHIACLCAQYDIDILFCSYIFQSKMLEFVPKHILRVIDTHDKMGDRYAAQKARGLKTEFFSCTPEDEGRYLRRADIVVARRDEEARYFDEVSGRDTAIVIPHVEPPRFSERRFTRLDSVGLVASANKINLDLVTDFLDALAEKTHNAPPFSLRIAGQVASMLDDVPQPKRRVFTQPWVQLLGFVEDIGEFYASVDLVVSPVLFGTGINVKTVQAMSHGMPLVTTECGSKGIETGHPMHMHETMEGVVENVLRLKTEPELLEELATCSRERYTVFYDASLAGFDFLLNACRNSN